MDIFAMPGESLQQFGGECPEGWVVMSSDRPSPSHVANTSGEWVEVNTVHTRCTPAQGLVALFIVKNITESDVLTAIDNISNPLDKYMCQVGYTRATEWDRTSDSFQRVAEILQLSELDIDNLFDIAITVKV